MCLILTSPSASRRFVSMRRKGFILLLTFTLTAGFAFPLPECFLTKVNCNSIATASCPVFAGKCVPMKTSCGRECPFSDCRDKQQQPEKYFKPFQKLKFYTMRSLVSLVPNIDWAFVVASDESLFARDAFRIRCIATLANGGERASPIFLQKQSFLF
jgi:hypothetical protein